MSAHVIAKAQPFSAEDDEKTTIESGWEEEASTTTVEQNEVADKIRALGVEAPTHRRGGTNSTSNGSPMMDEPTVDDQRANALIAMLPPPPSEPARLIITQGNDSGAELQVSPGKTYTIGRAIDNDVVLTDIAVSRKHFDLTFDGGAWVLIDRGSGNGTLVNGNVEDQPFMLANGDTIEIGNTVFRFDNANGVTREAASYLDAEEEEPSTVAGKPMGRVEIETPVTLPPPAVITRPKTIPPPLPRPRTQSGPPAPLYPPPNGLAPNGLASSVMPSTTLPLPQMAGRAPVATPQAPTLLGHDSMQRPQVLLGPQPMPTPQHMPLQTTIPGGHNAPPPSIPPIQGMPFGYPVLGMDRPSAPGHAQMLVIAAAHAQGRDAPTTAHVSPVPYSAVMMPQSHSYASPQLSRKMKMVLGGAALALVAAVATVAIIKGASRSDVVADDIVVPATPTATTKTPPKTTIEPIKEAKTALPAVDDAAKKKLADDQAKKLADDKRKAEDQAKRDEEARAKKAADDQAKRDEQDRIKKAADDKRVFEAQEAARKKDEQAKRDEDLRKKAADDKRAADQEARRKAAEEVARKADDKKKAAAEEAQRKADERRKAAAEEAQRKADEKKKAVVVASSDGPTRTNKTGPSDSVAHAKNDANSAYRSKNFQQAANILRGAVGGASSDETTDLKSLARSYEQFGKAYNTGMSPGAKPNEAFPQLRTAVNFDAGIGGAYTSEIRARLGEVAPAAAVFYFTHKSYKDALAAVQTAESLNASNSTTQTVRSKLESEANRLYNEANSEAQTNTPDAKDKLARIKDMLESKSSTYQKASKLLASLP